MHGGYHLFMYHVKMGVRRHAMINVSLYFLLIPIDRFHVYWNGTKPAIDEDKEGQLARTANSHEDPFSFVPTQYSFLVMIRGSNYSNKV